MLSTYTTAPSPRQPSPLPRRTDSLSTSIAKPKPTSPLIQSREDVKFARTLLTALLTDEVKADVQVDEEQRARRSDDRNQELAEMLGRMTNWVEELATLLQQSYRNETELETAITLTRSNLQLALANNEMLEEALKRGGGGGQDVGWRRWSEREGVRRSGSVKEYVQHERLNNVTDAAQQQPQSVPSRFFNFKSPLQRLSSTNTSPTATSASPPYASASASASTPSLLPSISIPSTSRSPSPAPPSVPSLTTIASSVPSSSRSASPSPTHTAHDAQPATSQFHTLSRSMSQSTHPTSREKELTSLLDKERAALKALADAKAQLEDELEGLSQALFEEANKMVSKANRKLAETEEELRIAMEQKEALRGALRIVEGENGALRGAGASERDADRREEQSTRGEDPKQLRGKDVQHAQGNETLMDAVRPNDYGKDTTSVSHNHPQNDSQSNSTPLHDPTHPARLPPLQGPPTTPPVTVTEAHPAITSQTVPVQMPSTDSPAYAPNQDAPARSTTAQRTQAPNHPWSILPVNPDSRDVVRRDFEDAMRRMRKLVGEDEGEEDSAVSSDCVEKMEEGEDVIEGEYLGENIRDDVKATRLDGGVNPWRT